MMSDTVIGGYYEKVTCPLCREEFEPNKENTNLISAIELKPSRPVRFILTCPHCSQQFGIDIHKDHPLLTFDLVEELAQLIHKAYCMYCLEVKGKDYWTGGDYSKLDEEAKEADRYIARFIIQFLGPEGEPLIGRKIGQMKVNSNER